MLKLYNTLTRKTEDFTPTNRKAVNLYTCGPTVYNFAHIGNFRSYLFADSVFRALEYQDLSVKWVMNLTDVDDKTIKGTIKEFGSSSTIKELEKFTDRYIQIFLSELSEIGIDPKKITIIRVSEVIPEIQKFILELLNKGYAYQSEDGVFFNISKYQEAFGDYGELVGQKFLEGKQVGARVAVDEYEKENLSDFALWKAHSEEDGQIFWDHPILGKGRPGWHIECSVINQVGFNGEPTDIHTGGIDLIFPHHTNEIAQSQPLYGKPFSKIWMHGEHLQIDNKKMAKRDGNVFLLKDLAEKDPKNLLAFRYLCLQTDFRKPMNFTWESLEAAKNALEKLKNKIAVIARSDDALVGTTKQSINQNTDTGLPRPSQSLGARNDNTIHANDKFIEAISNDLNLPQALAILWEVVNDNELNNDDKYTLTQKFDCVLGLNLDSAQANPIEIPEEIQKLINMRDEARKNRDFAESDNLRKQIEDLGFAVKDTPDGTQITKI
jgi:cysteinyl-tRNA synthetase